MRTKLKKWASPLFIVSLAVAGIFGVTAGIVDKQVKETPVVEEADAATDHNIVYYKGSLNAPLIHYWGGTGGSTWDHEPQMNWINYGYSGGNTNALWWFDIGNNNKFLIRNPQRSWQSADQSFSSSTPVFNNNNNTLEAIPSDIKSISSGNRVYLFADTAVAADSATFKIKFDNNAPCTADSNFDMINITGTNYWYFDIGASAKFFMFQRYNSTGATFWNETNVFTYSQSYTRPILKWSDLSHNETRGYLPESIKVKGEYNSWTDETFNFDSSSNVFYKDITTTADNQQIYIHAQWNKGESTDTAIGYSDGISSVATYVDGSSNIKIKKAGKYRIKIGPNVWLYDDKQNIWGTNDGSTIVQLFTVSFAAGSGGSVSSSSIANVPSGSSITVNSNKVTINGTTVTATPSAATAQYTYSFNNWSNATGTITANRTITANFTATVNKYTVTFNVNDARYGSINKTSITNVPYGSAVSISNNTLTINGTTVTATVETPPDGYKNSFVEWTNAPATITSAITITATFSQVSGQALAQEYAFAFNSAISEACDYYGDTDVEALAEAWSAQNTAYDGLEAYVQYWVLNDRTVAAIVNMRAKYDYVYGKYGEDIGEDFLDRNPTPVSAIRDFKPFALFGDDEEALTNGVIVTSSSIAFVSIAALSLLVIKKRKLKK